MNVSGGAWSRLRKALQERRAQRDAKRLSASRIDQAVESIVDASNPRIRAVAGYRKILRPIAERTLAHCAALVARIPGPVTASKETWVKDPVINALFGSIDSLRETLTRSPAVRRSFRDHPEWNQCHALLRAKIEQREELGTQLRGDAPQREVRQIRITFTDHELEMPSASEQELRTSLEGQLLMQCVGRAAHRLSERQSEIDRLDKQRQILKSKVRLQEKAQGQAPTSARRELEEVENAIAAARQGLNGFSDYLDRLTELMEDPASLFRLETQSFRLDRMNLIHNEEDDKDTVKLSFCRSIVYDQPDTVLLVLHIPRSELLSEDHFLKKAERLLGA